MPWTRVETVKMMRGIWYEAMREKKITRSMLHAIKRRWKICERDDSIELNLHILHDKHSEVVVDRCFSEKHYCLMSEKADDTEETVIAYALHGLHCAQRDKMAVWCDTMLRERQLCAVKRGCVWPLDRECSYSYSSAKRPREIAVRTARSICKHIHTPSHRHNLCIRTRRQRQAGATSHWHVQHCRLADLRFNVRLPQKQKHKFILP